MIDIIMNSMMFILSIVCSILLIAFANFKTKLLLITVPILIVIEIIEIGIIAQGSRYSHTLHTPPQEYSMTAEGGALVPREWCIHSGEMVHGGRRRGAPSRHAVAYSGRALRLRMDSPSIWIVYAL